MHFLLKLKLCRVHRCKKYAWMYVCMSARTRERRGKRLMLLTAFERGSQKTYSCIQRRIRRDLEAARDWWGTPTKVGRKKAAKGRMRRRCRCSSSSSSSSRVVGFLHTDWWLMSYQATEWLFCGFRLHNVATISLFYDTDLIKAEVVVVWRVVVSCSKAKGGIRARKEGRKEGRRLPHTTHTHIYRVRVRDFTT